MMKKVFLLRRVLTTIFISMLLAGNPSMAQMASDQELDYGYYNCYEGSYDDDANDDDWFFDFYDWDDCAYGFHYDWDYDYDYDWDNDLFEWEEERLF